MKDSKIERYKFINGIIALCLICILFMVFIMGITIPSVFDEPEDDFSNLDYLFIVVLILVSVSISMFILANKKLEKGGKDARKEE